MKDHPEPECCPDCEETIRQLQKIVATSEGADRAYALFELGSAALFTGRDELSLASFGACLELAPAAEDSELESEALFKQSCVLAIFERYDEAIESVTKAKKICKKLGDSEHLALCEWREGIYHSSLGDRQIALPLIEAARDRYLRIDRPAAAALCEIDLGNIKSVPERAAFDTPKEKKVSNMVSYDTLKKTQTLVQLTPDLLAALDQQAASSGRSRSDIIREAIRHYLDEVLDDEIDKKIVAGYRKKPQEPDPWAEAATREAIAAEPW